MKILSTLIMLFITQLSFGDDAELVQQGIFGECKSTYASANDGLILYREHNISSEKYTLSFKKGWAIKYNPNEGVTKVITSGKIEVAKEYILRQCHPKLKNSVTLEIGTQLNFLYYLGEGYGKIDYEGTQCDAEIDEGFGYFKHISSPIIQVWIKVLNADESLAGWLLYNGVQTKITGVEC